MEVDNMAYDDEPIKIGDYVFERHEGDLYCYPFFDKEGNYDKSRRLTYYPVDMLYDLEDCFNSFKNEYKTYDVDDVFDIKFTIEEWVSFFKLAVYESVSFLACDSFHKENKKYGFDDIKNMIIPISSDVINIQWIMVSQGYSVGVIEDENELIITSVEEIDLDCLQNLKVNLINYSLVKLDTTGFIKYYVFRFNDDE